MGMFGPMMILIIIGFMLYIFALKVVGSVGFGKEHKSTEEAIQRDTDEFNKF